MKIWPYKKQYMSFRKQNTRKNMTLEIKKTIIDMGSNLEQDDSTVCSKPIELLHPFLIIE
jgi:hypothetical protein